jgi:hypothetical protein
MHKTLLALVFLTLAIAGLAQTSPETAIRQIMADQAAAWNKGDIDAFMKGYWNNDSLVFVRPVGPELWVRQDPGGLQKAL